MRCFNNPNNHQYLYLIVQCVLLVTLILFLSLDIFWVDENIASEQKQKLRETFGNSYRTIRDACSDPKIKAMKKVQVPHFRFIFDQQSKESLLICKLIFKKLYLLKH